MKKDNKVKIAEELSLEEAVKVLKENAKAKFGETVDLDIVLNLKESQKNESIRGTVSFPHKFGKEKRVIVLCEEKDVDAAKKAGAIEAGLAELEKKLMDGWKDFDVVIATPAVMPKIARLGKVLGPTGLMPSPKNETVTTDVEKAVKNFLGGKSGFKMEQKQGVVRAKIAKVEQPEEQIIENAIELLKSVTKEVRKFASSPFAKITIKSTMGPGVRLKLNDIIARIG